MRKKISDVKRRILFSVFLVLSSLFFLGVSYSQVSNLLARMTQAFKTRQVRQFQDYIFPSYEFVMKYQNGKEDSWGYNFEHAYDLGLTDERGLVSQAYLDHQQTYRNMMESYLNRTLKLVAFDQELSDSPLARYFRRTVSRVADTETYYHSLSHLAVPYLYVRNNLHIEHLSREEVGFLKHAKDKSQAEQDQFVKETLRRVIDEIPSMKKLAHTNYYSTGAKPFLYKDSLVLFIDYVDPEDEERINPDHADRHFWQWVEYEHALARTIRSYEIQFSQELGFRVQIHNPSLPYIDEDGKEY